MGYEFGQFDEWNYNTGLEFYLRDQFDKHKKLAVCVKELNEFYKTHPALYAVEDSWDGFEWISPDDADSDTIAFIRRDREGNEIIAVTSFSGGDYLNYRLGVNTGGRYKIVFNTDDTKYGGEGKVTKKSLVAKKQPAHGRPYSIEFTVPKFSTLYLEHVPEKKDGEEDEA